jgi:hypothetical protein
MEEQPPAEELAPLVEEPVEELALVQSVRVIEPARASPPALIQAAAAAATGFVAGAATVAVLSRRRGARVLPAPLRNAAPALQPHGETRTYLVQVRALRRG